ncbi:hypothetical protein BH11BAC6_BH11BAC6_02430 [soil metagenome]
MSLNLLQSLQTNTGYAALKKIDPNTQQTTDDGTIEDKLNQAVIPGVLIVLYKYTRTDAGAQRVITESLSNEWLQSMLGEDTGDAVNKVAEYSGVTTIRAKERMEMIARQAVGLIRESNPASANDVKNILSGERNNILKYLPPTLHMGELLNDNTLDDNVTKMEGPVSGLMNAIGNIFSGSEKTDKN